MHGQKSLWKIKHTVLLLCHLNSDKTYVKGDVFERGNMVFSKPAYFEKNKEWYFFDPRVFRLRLTDKATPKAIESYIERYCQLEGSGILNIDWAHLREEITERTTQDIAEFKHNKSRYELKPNDFGTMELVSIDGEPIS